MTANEKIFIGPKEGARLPVLDITHKLRAEDSGGSLTVEEWGLIPRRMIPPHTHSREDECSFVLEGELTCFVGDEVAIAPKGSCVFKPRGVAHAFYNAGSEAVRAVEVFTPGGLEDFFNEYEDIVARVASGEIEEEEHRRARAELGARYGIVWHDERIPAVRARFGLEP